MVEERVELRLHSLQQRKLSPGLRSCPHKCGTDGARGARTRGGRIISLAPALLLRSRSIRTLQCLCAAVPIAPFWALWLSKLFTLRAITIFCLRAFEFIHRPFRRDSYEPNTASLKFFKTLTQMHFHILVRRFSFFHKSIGICVCSCLKCHQLLFLVFISCYLLTVNKSESRIKQSKDRDQGE